MEEVQKSWTQ